MTNTGFTTAIQRLHKFSGDGADTRIRIRTKTGNEIIAPDTRSITQLQESILIDCKDFCTVVDYDSIESLQAETKEMQQMRHDMFMSALEEFCNICEKDKK